MAIKKYRVTDEAENYVELLVDTDVLTPALATEINEFWFESDSRLADQNDDVVATVVRLFGVLALRHFQEDGGVSFADQLQGNHAHLMTNRVIGDAEGWPCSSFELGIQIVDALVEPVVFDTVRLSEITS